MTVVLDLLLQWGPHGPHTPMGPHGGAAAGSGMNPWFGMGAGVGLLWWLAVLALVVGVVVVAAVALLRTSRNEETGDDALAVLRERYARGDIDDEEFDRRRGRLDDRGLNGGSAG